MIQHRYRPADPDKLDPDPDPDLVLVAAHELGHVLVNQAHGITVVSVEVDRRAYTGLTSTDGAFDDPANAPDLVRGWLIASVAGFEAEQLWCARHGGSANRRCSRTDFANFAAHRHRVGLSTTVARPRARSILMRHWPRVERWAPRLAARGHLPPDVVAGDIAAEAA